MRNLFLTLCCIMYMFSCKTESELSSSKAERMVEEYLLQNPHFETTNFNTNRMRLNSKNDEDLISQIQTLEEEGWIEIVDEKSRKRWFSKDSVFVITPSLTTKSLPYIVQQNRNNTQVKTIVYELDKSRGIIFNRKAKKTATFNAVLMKNKTPFYDFGKDQNPNSNFITKSFRARFTESEGWKLVE